MKLEAFSVSCKAEASVVPTSLIIRFAIAIRNRDSFWTGGGIAAAAMHQARFCAVRKHPIPSVGQAGAIASTPTFPFSHTRVATAPAAQRKKPRTTKVLVAAFQTRCEALSRILLMLLFGVAFMVPGQIDFCFILISDLRCREQKSL